MEKCGFSNFLLVLTKPVWFLYLFSPIVTSGMQLIFKISKKKWLVFCIKWIFWNPSPLTLIFNKYNCSRVLSIFIKKFFYEKILPYPSCQFMLKLFLFEKLMNSKASLKSLPICSLKIPPLRQTIRFKPVEDTNS